MTGNDNDKRLVQPGMEDDRLLMQFFGEHQLGEVPDNGFSERVMEHLPDSRLVRLSRLWTMVCMLIGLAGFVRVRGWNVLFHYVERLEVPRLQYLPMVAWAYMKAFLASGYVPTILASVVVIAAVWIYNEMESDLPDRRDVRFMQP